MRSLPGTCKEDMLEAGTQLGSGGNALGLSNSLIWEIVAIVVVVLLAVAGCVVWFKVKMKK